MKKLFVFMALAAFLVASAGADVYIKSKTHTDPMSMMGQNTPAKDDIVEQWLGDDMFSMKTGGTGSIVDLKKGVIYIINHNEKSYIESTLPLDFSKLLPAEMAAMAQGMMKMTVTVVPQRPDQDHRFVALQGLRRDDDDDDDAHEDGGLGDDRGSLRPQ